MSLEQLSIHRTAPCTRRVALGLPSLMNHECWHWSDSRRQIMRRHCRCSLHIDRCDAQRSLCCSVQRLVCTSLAPSLISRARPTVNTLRIIVATVCPPAISISLSPPLTSISEEQKHTEQVVG